MVKKIRLFMLSSLLVFSCLLMGFLNGCSEKPREQIVIAEQFGLAYAPLQVMKERNILEKNLPGVKVIWKQMGNTTAIREAMLAGNLDVGFMAIPPFLIGWAKGMEWKMISGLSVSPLGLITYRDELQSIRDFTENDRIALPQPGSIQHILLAMACQQEFSDAGKLDDLLVTMAHPDGMNALLSRQEITAHFTSPPYIFQELQQADMHQILSGQEVMGKEFTFIIGAATKTFHDRQPKIYRAFVKSLLEAIDLLRDQPEYCAEILAPQYQLTKADILTYITWPGMSYTSKIKGLDEFADFLSEQQYILKTFDHPEEIMWDVNFYEK